VAFLLPHISPPPHWQISPASRKVTNALCNQNKSGVMFKLMIRCDLRDCSGCDCERVRENIHEFQEEAESLRDRHRTIKQGSMSLLQAADSKGLGSDGHDCIRATSAEDAVCQMCSRLY
jgi:hypothetical protein